MAKKTMSPEQPPGESAGPAKQPPPRPAYSARLKGLRLAVFENRTSVEGREASFFKVSLQKVYRDGEDWKTTTSYGRDDLPVARLLLQRAWEWILEKESNRTEGQEGE